MSAQELLLRRVRAAGDLPEQLFGGGGHRFYAAEAWSAMLPFFQ